MKTKRIAAALIALLITVGMFSAFAASNELTSLRLSSNNLVLRVGETFNLGVVIAPSDCMTTRSDLVWETSDYRVVTVVNGTLHAERNGGAYITVRTKDGKKMDVCYVGVGGPYNGYYEQYPNNRVSYLYLPDYPFTSPYAYPYIDTYYGTGAYATLPYAYYYGDIPYPSYSYYPPIQPYQYYYDNSRGYWVQVKSSDPIVSYVVPGKAMTSGELCVEFRQGLVAKCDGEQVNVGFVASGNSLVVQPKDFATYKDNTLQFAGNILSRFEAFNFKNIQYIVPGLTVQLTPEINNSKGVKLCIKQVVPVGKMGEDWKQYKRDVISGPWSIDINSKKNGVMLQMLLDRKYSKKNISLLKYDENDKCFVEIDPDDWKLMRKTIDSDDGDCNYEYYVFSPIMKCGTYAVVKK